MARNALPSPASGISSFKRGRPPSAAQPPASDRSQTALCPDRENVLRPADVLANEAHHIFTKGQWRRARFLNHPEVKLTMAVNFSPFSPFAAVSLFGVAGLAETFPSFSASGPFLLDVPGFQVPSDSIVPPQIWSSSRALSRLLHFCNCSDVFSFTSSFDVAKPFQPSPSHNRRHRFHRCFFQDLLISPVF